MVGNVPKMDVLPAHAGVIPEMVQFLTLMYGSSRTRGGDPQYSNEWKIIPKFFPHTRG